MNLGAEISHQYISFPSSLLTGRQARGMSCTKVNGYPEVARCPHLASYLSPRDAGHAICAKLTGVSGVRFESLPKSQAEGTICGFYMQSTNLYGAFILFYFIF